MNLKWASHFVSEFLYLNNQHFQIFKSKLNWQSVSYNGMVTITNNSGISRREGFFSSTIGPFLSGAYTNSHNSSRHSASLFFIFLFWLQLSSPSIWLENNFRNIEKVIYELFLISPFTCSTWPRERKRIRILRILQIGI